MVMNKINNLQNLLSYLPEGKGIYLGDDIFLIGKELDGSNKCYGFYKEGGKFFIVTRSSNGYPINDMDREDLDYIFNLSNIHVKLNRKLYPIVKREGI